MSYAVTQAPTEFKNQLVFLPFMPRLKGTFSTLPYLCRSVSALLLAVLFTGRKLAKSYQNKTACPVMREDRSNGNERAGEPCKIGGVH